MEERGALCGENQGYQEAAKPEQIGLSSLCGSVPFVIYSNVACTLDTVIGAPVFQIRWYC